MSLPRGHEQPSPSTLPYLALAFAWVWVAGVMALYLYQFVPLLRSIMLPFTS